MEKTMRTFLVYVEDKPGVLNRVASLFRRRNYNIDSLNVGKTNEPGVSRMTIVCEANEDTARRMQANLYKLVNVLRVDDISEQASLERTLALVKVRAGSESRPEIMRVCDTFRARIVDVGIDTVIVEATGARHKIEALVEMLEPFGVLEMVETGSVAMQRGAEGPGVMRCERPKSTARAA
ncbi:MAG: acetolactate synthase small subunit [Myxococcales bacterium]|nr:acetolactate synthase small subunit [Myxococcales bacterium]